MALEFAERYRRIVLPWAERLELLDPLSRTLCAGGIGPLDDEAWCCCYCLCLATMHYHSFQMALDASFQDARTLPRAPLIVDLGCGPATTLFALNDWRLSHGEQRGGTYLGIDASPIMRRTATQLIELDPVGSADLHILSDSIDAIRDESLTAAIGQSDGVIFAMSYIIHQPFMSDLIPLIKLMRRIKQHTPTAPTWLLHQDQNSSANRDGLFTDWPETRLRRLVDACEDFGYEFDVNKKTLIAPKISVSAAGNFTPQEPRGTKNVCYFFTQIRHR